jgi:hypothetical protein
MISVYLPRLRLSSTQSKDYLQDRSFTPTQLNAS